MFSSVSVTYLIELTRLIGIQNSIKLQGHVGDYRNVLYVPQLPQPVGACIIYIGQSPP